MSPATSRGVAVLQAFDLVRRGRLWDKGTSPSDRRGTA